MTKDAALKLALEALEGADMIDCDMREAITALKEALAQPEQKPVAAYLEVRRPNGPWQRYNLYSSVAVAEDAMRRIEGPPIEVRVLPLYTTPPKRTWVGLSEQEVSAIDKKYHKPMGPKEFAKEIEAKLKEKNT